MNNIFYYFKKGASLAFSKELRKYIYIPILISFLLLGLSFYYSFSWIEALMVYLENSYSWINYIYYLVYICVAIPVFILVFFISTSLTKSICSPFYGILSEQAEIMLTGNAEFIIVGANESNLSTNLFSDIGRSLSRELRKIYYLFPRFVLIFILSFIPIVGSILSLLFAGWSSSISYCDYPFDNHKVDFKYALLQFKNKRMFNIQYGVCINLLCIVPIINLIIMPIAVCASTVMWVEYYKEKTIEQLANLSSDKLKSTTFVL